MSRLESSVLLFEVAEAARAILEFTAGRSRDDLARDDLLRSAVYLKFILIGEALSKLKKIDEPMFNSISESWRIVGFRNQIVHGYAGLEDSITWQIVSNKLPLLLSEVTGLLGSPGDTGEK